MFSIAMLVYQRVLEKYHGFLHMFPQINEKLTSVQRGPQVASPVDVKARSWMLDWMYTWWT